MYCHKHLGREEAKPALEVILVIVHHSFLRSQVVQITTKDLLRNSMVFLVSPMKFIINSSDLHIKK